MSEPIKAGDLVVVIRPTPCCANESHVGYHFQVAEVRPARGRYHCGHCNTTWPTQTVAAGAPNLFVYQLWRLKRIQPLEELEGQRSQEDMKEPA